MNHRLSLGRLISGLVLPFLLAGCTSDRTPDRPADAAPKRAADAGPSWVYFGTYTGAKSKGIYVARLDPASGELSKPELAAESPSPSFLAVDPKGRFLYAVNEVDQFEGQKTGSVSSFAIDRATGKLSAINQKPSGGRGPCHLT